MASLRFANRLIATNHSSGQSQNLGSLFRVVAGNVARCTSTLGGVSPGEVGGSSFEYVSLQKRYFQTTRAVEASPKNLNAAEQFEYISNKLSKGTSKERKPALSSLQALISKAQSAEDIKLVQEAFLKYKKGFLPTSPEIAGLFVNACIDLGCTDVAVKTLIRRDEYGLWPGAMTYTRLMNKISSQGRVKEVCALLDAFKNMDGRPYAPVDMYRSSIIAVAFNLENLGGAAASSEDTSSSDSSDSSSSSSSDDEASEASSAPSPVETAEQLFHEAKASKTLTTREMDNLSIPMGWVYALGGRPEDALNVLSGVTKPSPLFHYATLIARAETGDLEGARGIFDGELSATNAKDIIQRAQNFLDSRA